MQPAHVDENGKKMRKLDTMNARTETVGESRLYGKVWREQRCLIPAQWIYEPSYETGKNVWQRIGLTDWRPYYEDQDGRSLIGISMLTVNANGHPVMSRMHKPNDEKRSVMILDSAAGGL